MTSLTKPQPERIRTCTAAIIKLLSLGLVVNSPASSTPVTLIISEVVKTHRLRDYEVWVHGINQALQQVEGFLEVEILRPRDMDASESVVIIKFDTYAHLRDWFTSPTYKAWMEKSRGLFERHDSYYLPRGLEVWFSLPGKSAQPPEPAYYKKVVLGVLSVYPLILLSNALLGPLLAPLPPLLGLLISVIFVSVLLTYPVMPMLSRLLQFWLYPSH